MCRDCNTKRHVQYRKTENGRIKTNNAVYRSTKKYPARQKARLALNYALTTGKIKKPILCQECNSMIKLEAHHPDYTKPFDVFWYCRPCHSDKHKLIDLLK